MPNLSEKENALLKTLGSAVVMGKARLKEVSALIHRLMYLADDADKGKRVAEMRYSFIAGAVHGILSKEDILAKGLPAPLQEEAIALRQQHEDVQSWREHVKKERLWELDKDDQIAMELSDVHQRETANETNC